MSLFLILSTFDLTSFNPNTLFLSLLRFSLLLLLHHRPFFSSTSKIRNIFSLRRRMLKAGWTFPIFRVGPCLKTPARRPHSTCCCCCCCYCSSSSFSFLAVPLNILGPLLFSPSFSLPSSSIFQRYKNDPDAANYVKYLIRRISVIGIMAGRYGIELPLYMAHSSCV